MKERVARVLLGRAFWGLVLILPGCSFKMQAPEAVVSSLGAVGGLEASQIAQNSLRLSWVTLIEATYYEIEGSHSTATLSLPHPESETLISGLTANTAYQFRIRACLNRGSSILCGEYSPSITASTLANSGGGGDTIAPSVPAGLQSPSKTANSISLNWSPSSDNVAVTGYQVSINNGNGIDTVSPPYVANGLSSATAYTFKVRARDAAGNWSAYSQSISVSTLAATTPTPTPSVPDTIAPTVPANLTAPSSSASSVSLSWSPSSDNVGVTGYQVSINNGQGLDTVSNSYIAQGLVASTSYSFRVRARDAAGNFSAYSASVSKSTAASSSWVPPSGPIPSTSGFFPLLSAVDVTTKESYRVLYHWLAQYTTVSFDIPKGPIAYDAGFLASDDQTFRLRALLANVGRQMPDPMILQASSDKFLLSTIDANGKLMTRKNTTYPFVEPSAGVWHYIWDYPGNSNYQAQGLMHRAFAYAIPMMVWTDNAHHKNLHTRTDFAGGALIKFAIPYAYGKHLLPPVVQQAYSQILIKMFNRLMNPSYFNGTFGDMEIQAAVGMYYAAIGLGGTYLNSAATHAQWLFERMINGAGFEKHENGADVTYQGIAQYFMGWLLSATQSNSNAAALYSWLPAFQERSCKFLNHMTLKEPSAAGAKNKLIGPNHFNAATGGSLGQFIWGSGYRSFFAGGWYAPSCRTVLHNPYNATYHWYSLADSPSKMRTDIQTFLGPNQNVNLQGSGACSDWSVVCNSSEGPTHEMDETHWTNDIAFAYSYTHYLPGYYSQLMNEKNTGAEVSKYPHQYASNFIEELKDIFEPDPLKQGWFVTAKSNALHAIVHIGGLAWRNSATNVAGFGGGAISSISTTGPIIMGSENGNQNTNPGPFQISDWRVWPTHHIAGLDSSGKYFGTARDRNLNRTVVRNGNTSFTATVNGTIGASSNALTNPGGNIAGMSYQRVIGFSQSSGVSVQSTISTNGASQASELWDIIPVFIGHTGNNDCVANPSECTEISFRVNGAWTTPSTTLMAVSDIRLNRYNAPIYVHFSSPRQVKLSASELTLTWEPRRHRNLMINLIQSPGSGNQSLPVTINSTYTIDTVAP